MTSMAMADDVSRLVDQFGRPFSRAEIANLREEISPPNAGQGRAPFNGHLAFGIDPSRLGAVLRAADNGSSREWMILAEEVEELFPHYLSVLSKRRRQVSQLPVTVLAAMGEDAYDQHAQFVRDWITTGVLARAMFDITDAIGKGFSVSEILWQTEPGRVRPAEIAYRPPHFFELSWEDGATVRLRTQAGFVDLAPHKFLLHTHRSKSGLVVRSGLTRSVVWLWMWSSFTLKDWAVFVQGYGLPIRLGRYGPEASYADKRTLWRAVSSIAGDVAAIIPKSMELEIVKDTDRAAGSELYLKRANWLNHEVSKLVLGSTAGTDAINGSHAVGQEHREAENDVELFDAGMLGNSITRQLVHTMIGFTFGPQREYPVVTIGRPNRVPLPDVITAIADLGGMGLRVKASEVLELLQLSMPEDGDATIGGILPAEVPKPHIPHPVRVPPKELQSDGRDALDRRWLGNLISRHAEAPPEVVEQLTLRLAEDAAAAMAGLTDRIRAEFDAAHSMQDLVHRLDALALPAAEFAEAMARGMALAELVGQASLIEDLRTRH